MKQMPTVSIIVPVYNSERYIFDCINSILKQTFTDFELLLIDDGSKDDSLGICQAFEKRDSRIRLYHKENGGVSSARNIGLDNALGDYLAFCDSDDFVEPEWIETLVHGIRRENLDVVVSGFNAIIDGECYDKIGLGTSDSVLTKSHFFQLRKSGMDSFVWNKLFVRKIIDQEKLRFDCEVSYGEDSIFVLNYLLSCKGDIGISNTYTYNYRVSNKDSLTKKYIPNIGECLQKVLLTRKKAFDAFGVDWKQIGQDYANSLVWNYQHVLENYFSNAPSSVSINERKEQIRKIIKSVFFDFTIRNSNQISNKVKALYLTKSVQLLWICRTYYERTHKIDSIQRMDNQ